MEIVSSDQKMKFPYFNRLYLDVETSVHKFQHIFLGLSFNKLDMFCLAMTRKTQNTLLYISFNRRKEEIPQIKILYSKMKDTFGYIKCQCALQKDKKGSYPPPQS